MVSVPSSSREPKSSAAKSTNQTLGRALGKTPGKTLIRSASALAISLWLAIGLSGCRTRGSVDVDSTPDQTFDRSTVLENQDTGAKITVPPRWQVDNQLRGDADIYATYPAQELYASVVSEGRADLSQFGLEDNAEQYRWLIERQLGDYETSIRTGIEQVNGDPAVQYEIRGQVDGVPVVYLHTTIQGEDNYYQVVGWTSRDRYADNREVLQGVIESFEDS